MGYATARHRAALATHGAMPRLHRQTFAPLRLLLDGGADSPATGDRALEFDMAVGE